MLDRSRNREKVSSKFRVAVAATTLGVLLPVASYSPWVSEATAATLAPASTGVSTALAATGVSTALAATPIGNIIPVIKAVQSSDEALGLAAKVPTSTATQAMGCWDTGKNHSTSIHSDSDDSENNRMTVTFSSGDCTLELRSAGKFTLRSDLSDVATMDRNGWLTVEERSSGTTRRIEIRSSSSGLDHIYSVNGSRAEYSSEARAWLAQILLAVERRTAFAASTRVPQIFQERGAKGVLDEVSLMPSDYAKSTYLSVLLRQSNLDAPTLTRIVQQSQREMTSDYYLAEVIGKIATQRNADAGTWRAFADASTSIKSDYYKSQVIGKVLSRDQLDNQTLATLLKGAATINSDYYQAEVLKSMSKKYAVTAQSRPYYVAALNRITSDYYRSEVLSYLNTGEPLDASTTADVLKSITDMKSDYYKSQALSNIIKLGRLDASTRDEYFSAIKSIDSDYYKHEALNATLAMRPLSRETVASLLAVSQTIKSDYELSAFLTSIASAYPIDDSLRAAFDRAVDSIQSDYYRGAALSAVHRATR